ncbi:hypothetical protein ACFT25_16010 [Streptomyces hydrogenans]|uniref:hypothetical protein n=1 Tax=Streptomyces hydrogenans TaxID=1873719 RepID=UPI003631FCF8
MPFPTPSLTSSPLPTEPAAPTWPTMEGAVERELTHLAELLTTTIPAIPEPPSSPGGTDGARVRTTGHPRDARFADAAAAGSVFTGLRSLVEAAARPCDGSDVEAGAPRNPNRPPAPLTD